MYVVGAGNKYLLCRIQGKNTFKVEKTYEVYPKPPPLAVKPNFCYLSRKTAAAVFISV